MGVPEPAQRRDVRLVWRVLGSVLGGALLVASFPPYDLVWLAPPALALLTLSWHGVRARRGFWLAYLGGLTFLALHLLWMRVIGDDAWLLLAGVFALAVGLVGAGVAATSSLRVWPLAVPLMWVASEALRDRVPLGGFPWGGLAFGQTDTTLTPYAALAGAPAVTFVTALVGALLAFAWLERRRPRATIGALVGVAVLVTAGGVIPLPVGGQDGGGPSSVTVAVIQGNVPGAGMDALGEREAVLRNHVAQTEVLAADVAAGRVSAPELVVWPENSSDIDPLADSAAHDLIQRAADAIDVPILVGAVVEAPGDPTHILNMGIVWEPTSSGAPGPAGYYIKQHPVPFGEWVPARDLLARVIGRFDRVPRDFAPGSRTGVVQIGPARLGDLICFEVAYDELARAAVRGDGVEGPGADGIVEGDGARILAVQTNNATYGRTGQPEQQLAMSRLRAIEHGRTILIAATSGISAIVAPDGSITGQLAEFTAGYLVQSVPLRDDLTVADRVGALPEYLAVAGAIGLLVLAAVRRRRSADVGSGSVQQTEETV